MSRDWDEKNGFFLSWMSGFRTFKKSQTPAGPCLAYRYATYGRLLGRLSILYCKWGFILYTH